jgi:hypothetical protein
MKMEQRTIDELVDAITRVLRQMARERKAAA